MHINKNLSECQNDSDWIPYHGCLLEAAFVKMVSCLAKSVFLLILMLDPH